MIKKLTVPILDATLFLVQEKDIVEVQKRFGLTPTPNASGIAGYREDNDGMVYLISINEFSHDTIAHEALHVIHFIMRDKGIKSDINNDEFECYLLSWVINQCYRYFKPEISG
jgi:hypothetical protein